MTANPPTPSDAALMAAVRSGDTERLEELFRRHHRQVYGFLRRASRNEALADDLTQEVFLRVLRYRSSFDGRRPFLPWLFRIARNVLADGFQKQAPAALEARQANAIPDPRPSAHRRLEGRERLARLEWALGHLSAEQRDALLLARFHDLSYSDIGEVLDCSEGAVKGRVFRALRSISELLQTEAEPTL